MLSEYSTISPPLAAGSRVCPHRVSPHSNYRFIQWQQRQCYPDSRVEGIDLVSFLALTILDAVHSQKKNSPIYFPEYFSFQFLNIEQFDSFYRYITIYIYLYIYIYIYFERELFLEVLRVIFERREVKVEVLFQRKFRTGFPLKLSPNYRNNKVRDIFKFLIFSKNSSILHSNFSQS